MGAAGAANIIFAREIAKSEDPEATRAAKIEEYKEKFANPYVAASRGMVDDVIDPRDTRIKLIQGLDMLANKHETRPEKSTETFLYKNCTSLVSFGITRLSFTNI